MGESMQASVTNYVWYEFRLIRFAEQLWNASGEDGLRNYQRLLGHPELSYDQVVDRLSRLPPAVADAVRRAGTLTTGQPPDTGVSFGRSWTPHSGGRPAGLGTSASAAAVRALSHSRTRR